MAQLFQVPLTLDEKPLAVLNVGGVANVANWWGAASGPVVGDGDLGSAIGRGDGEGAVVDHPMVPVTQQHQVVQIGGAALTPRHDVVSVEEPLVVTVGDGAAAIADPQGTS